MKPYGKRILIEPETHDSPILADNDNLALRGVVLAVGEDCKWVQKGDTIYFLDFGVDTIRIGDKKYRFLLEDDAFLLAKDETVQAE